MRTLPVRRADFAVRFANDRHVVPPSTRHHYLACFITKHTDSRTQSASKKICGHALDPPPSTLATMRAAVITRQSDDPPEAIDVTHDWPEPDEPATGEVIVDVLCSSLNHMDLWVARGVPGLELEYPRVSGCDAVGTVSALGPRVDPAWLGRRVIVNAAHEPAAPIRPADPSAVHVAPAYQLIGEHSHGLHRARCPVPEAQLAAIPDSIDPPAAAAFALTFLTAYSMLRTKADLRPGQFVLITGIGGGVATAALSLCRWLACPAIVTSRHQHKLDRARELGAAHAIHDQGQDWSRDVRAFTAKRGVDLAIDSVGGPLHSLCLKSLARGGAFVTPGATADHRVDSDQGRIFWNQLRVLGSTMGTTDELKELAALFAAGHLSPVVDSVHPWRDARAAWARLQAQDQFGKIVLDWRDP